MKMVRDRRLSLVDGYKFYPAKALIAYEGKQM